MPNNLNLISSPSLVIEVKFNPNPAPSHPRFEYLMKLSNPGWAVDLLGNITPPPPNRVVRFELPEDGDTTILGLRLALIKSQLPQADDASSQRWFNQSGLLASVPMTEDYKYAVNCVLEPRIANIHYQLGVEHKGKHYWDDPRIYSDGSI